MTVSCLAMAEAGDSDASERNQDLAKDSSAMTIEFLRARLLSERAASKAVRDQAQQIANKVSELQNRLNLEIDRRRKAEAAAEEVFAVLKSKGLTEHPVAYASGSSPTLKSRESKEGTDEANGDIDMKLPLLEEEVSHTIDTEKADGLDLTATEENSQKAEAMVQQESGIEQDGLPSEGNMDEPLQHFREMGKECHVDGKDGDPKSPASSDLESEKQENELQHSRNIKRLQNGERRAVPKELKAMLQQIEEEVDSLPVEQQPLKLKLQGWVDHVVNILEDKETNLDSGLHVLESGRPCSDVSPSGPQGSGDNSKQDGNMPPYFEFSKHEQSLASTTPSHTGHKNTRQLDDEVLERDLSLSDNELPALSAIRGKPHSRFDYSACPPNANRPFSEAAVHKSKPLSNSLKGDYRNAPPIGMKGSFPFRDQSQVPAFAEVESYNFCRVSSTRGPIVGMGQVAHVGTDYIGPEWSYPAEVHRSRMQYEQWQDHKGLPQNKLLALENPAELRSREIYPCLAAMNDYSGDFIDMNTDFYGKQDMSSAFVGPKNLESERGHFYNTSSAYPQGGETLLFPRSDDGPRFKIQHPRSNANDVSPALMDDHSGRLGNILMALHLAKKQVKNDEHWHSLSQERVRPSMSAVGKMESNVGYNGSETQKGPYEDQPWRSDSQAPIIQFPTSPSSEHGFSVVERQEGLRRSKSVSVNFMMPAFEAHLQPRGKVHLGNGITLYTD